MHYVKSSLIWLTAIHTPTIFLLMLNVSSAQEIAEDPLWTCVCMKYGFGQPHRVSKSMWYRHLALATTENEKQRIRAARDPVSTHLQVERQAAPNAAHSHSTRLQTPQPCQSPSEGNPDTVTLGPGRDGCSL